MPISDDLLGDEAINNALATIGGGAGTVLSLIHGKGGTSFDVPKPFSEPVLLVSDTRVSGTTHIDGIEGISEMLQEGDRLRFERQPQNRFDEWAIAVYDSRDNRIGFVPADINEIPARLMDAGKRLFGKVTSVEQRGSWQRIGMAVYLDD
ncbi:MAG: HIRAN domain-containing protein [Atopobiaceae bacterium]|nr:HIRAN domain-containing protein [Atopobiaceae bacterium]